MRWQKMNMDNTETAAHSGNATGMCCSVCQKILWIETTMWLNVPVGTLTVTQDGDIFYSGFVLQPRLIDSFLWLSPLWLTVRDRHLPETFVSLQITDQKRTSCTFQYTEYFDVKSFLGYDHAPSSDAEVLLVGITENTWVGCAGPTQELLTLEAQYHKTNVYALHLKAHICSFWSF